MDTSWLRELKECETPEDFRAFCENTLVPRFRELAHNEPNLGLSGGWLNLAKDAQLVADDDTASDQELASLETKANYAEDRRLALLDVLLAFHEAHKDPITSDPDLCQNVECSRLRAQYRHLLRED